MCRVDYDEVVEIFQAADRKARKEQKCIECRRVIAPGETYHYEFGKFDGDAVTYKTCSHCMVAREWLQVNCGGWIYDEVIEEIREHAEEYPRLAIPLLRIAVGARRKWQAFKGGLMALPKQAPPITA